MPAIATLPDLAEVEVFSCQETFTEPLPDPLVGETTSQEPFPEAVQVPPEQPEGEPVTETTAEPDADVGPIVDGDTVKLEQVVGVVSRATTI